MSERRKFNWAIAIVLGAVGGVLAVGALLYLHSTGRVNKVALASSPKRVTAIAAVAKAFQPTRRYVGTVEPWVEAHVGPQLVSAYVSTVLVRPGSVVKRGEVIATLDCRHASALSAQVGEQARAVDAMSDAAAKEATRVSSLLDGKFVSENEVDLKKADAASKSAQVASLKAEMIGTALQVDDCVLRAPFDGEIATRDVDPGAFVRPGSSIATVVDRHLVRVTADVPEDDFAAVAPDAPVRVHLLATKASLDAKISRRAPSADSGTRTVRIEIDVEDSARAMPVWTTAELSLDVDLPKRASAIPLSAASVHGPKAQVFEVGGEIAHAATVPVIGERDGVLYLDPTVVPAGTQVVTEGRTTLGDRDSIAATVVPWLPGGPTK